VGLFLLGCVHLKTYLIGNHHITGESLIFKIEWFGRKNKEKI